MPYIEVQQQKRLDKQINALLKAMNGMVDIDGFKSDDIRKGVLNYVMTTLIIGVIGEELKYGKINDVVGAIECCKMELYRRLAVPYEDKKALLNGDVYDKGFRELKCKRTHLRKNK